MFILDSESEQPRNDMGCKKLVEIYNRVYQHIYLPVVNENMEMFQSLADSYYFNENDKKFYFTLPENFNPEFSVETSSYMTKRYRSPFKRTNIGENLIPVETYSFNPCKIPCTETFIRLHYKETSISSL